MDNASHVVCCIVDANCGLGVAANQLVRFIAAIRWIAVPAERRGNVLEMAPGEGRTLRCLRCLLGPVHLPFNLKESPAGSISVVFQLTIAEDDLTAASQQVPIGLRQVHNLSLLYMMI
jgi:hypothetical protein